MPSSILARLDLARGEFNLNVDLNLPGRGVSALFGHSGSGKTSCLRCLAGLERAQHAYIEVNGEVWEDSAKGYFLAPHKRAVGYVFRRPAYSLIYRCAAIWSSAGDASPAPTARSAWLMPASCWASLLCSSAVPRPSQEARLNGSASPAPYSAAHACC